MIEVDLRLVAAHHIDHPLAHLGNIETGRRGNFCQAQAHTRQFGDSGKQVALGSQLFEYLRRRHHQPLVLLDAALIDLDSLDDLVDGIFQSLLHVHGELTLDPDLDGSLHRGFHALLYIDGNFLFNRHFDTVLHALFDADGNLLLNCRVDAVFHALLNTGGQFVLNRTLQAGLHRISEGFRYRFLYTLLDRTFHTLADQVVDGFLDILLDFVLYVAFQGHFDIVVDRSRLHRGAAAHRPRYVSRRPRRGCRSPLALDPGIARGRGLAPGWISCQP